MTIGSRAENLGKAGGGLATSRSAEADVARAPRPCGEHKAEGTMYGEGKAEGGLATSRCAEADVARAPRPCMSLMASTVQTWKSVSSHRINRLLGRKGSLWQPDYYNHIIRTPGEYINQVEYVLGNNMVAAKKLVDDVASGGKAGGGLATSCSAAAAVAREDEAGAVDGDVARAPRPCNPRFPGKNRRHWIDIDVRQGESMPRWSIRSAIYHICFRLFDSVPQAKLREWENARENLRLRQRDGIVYSDDELRELKNQYSDSIGKYLDSGYGEALLRNKDVADVVIETLLHNNGRDYFIHAYGIMPNHVHVIAEFAGDAEADVARAPRPCGESKAGGGLATSRSAVDGAVAWEGKAGGGLATSRSAVDGAVAWEGKAGGGLATSRCAEADVARAPRPCRS